MVGSVGRWIVPLALGGVLLAGAIGYGVAEDARGLDPAAPLPAVTSQAEAARIIGALEQAGWARDRSVRVELRIPTEHAGRLATRELAIWVAEDECVAAVAAGWGQLALIDTHIEVVSDATWPLLLRCGSDGLARVDPPLRRLAWSEACGSDSAGRHSVEVHAEPLMTSAAEQAGTIELTLMRIPLARRTALHLQGTEVGPLARGERSVSRRRGLEAAVIAAVVWTLGLLMLVAVRRRAPPHARHD